jgi:hypothetical protein
MARNKNDGLVPLPKKRIIASPLGREGKHVSKVIQARNMLEPTNSMEVKNKLEYFDVFKF